uniref:Uncharacterized protein n=1 Tax=Hyaloperonospora arabidopsidis (strain Emoy2) TaxID=559515 RepID=M4BMW8_HYAAE
MKLDERHCINRSSYRNSGCSDRLGWNALRASLVNNGALIVCTVTVQTNYSENTIRVKSRTVFSIVKLLLIILFSLL